MYFGGIINKYHIPANADGALLMHTIASHKSGDTGRWFGKPRKTTNIGLNNTLILKVGDMAGPIKEFWDDSIKSPGKRSRTL